jgi:hypothetical protein
MYWIIGFGLLILALCIVFGVFDPKPSKTKRRFSEELRVTPRPQAAVAAEEVGTKESRRHISTTNNERYYHLKLDSALAPRATVFFRQEISRDEASPDDGWAASVALCDYRDHFVKSVGRNMARRKYFSGKVTPVEGEPTYDTAKKLAEAALVERYTYNHTKS